MAVTNRSYNRHCNGDLRDDPTLLEKVRHDARADHLAARVELHVHELAKPARVVVTDLCAPCACGRVRAVCVRVCVRTVLALPNASRIADVLMNRLRSAPSLPVGHMPSAACRAAARSHSLRRARRVRHTRHRRQSAMLSGRWGAGRGEGEGGGGSCHRPRHGWPSAMRTDAAAHPFTDDALAAEARYSSMSLFASVLPARVAADDVRLCAASAPSRGMRPRRSRRCAAAVRAGRADPRSTHSTPCGVGPMRPACRAAVERGARACASHARMWLRACACACMVCTHDMCACECARAHVRV